MNKQRLFDLADRYQAKADRAFYNYQETGVARYDATSRNNEELADALRMAANAADEHHSYIALKAQMAQFAREAQEIGRATASEREKRMEALRKNLVSYGKLMGMLWQE